MEIKRRKKKKARKKTKPQKKRFTPLSLRMRNFVKEYVIDFNRTRAVKDAGYSPNGAAVTAHRLLQDPRVQKLLERELERKEKRMEITERKVLQDLERARRAAFKDKQFSPAVKASELHGKHLAMFSDRMLHDVPRETLELAYDLPRLMENAGREVIGILSKLAEGGEEEREIVLEQKEVSKQLTIKTRRKKSDRKRNGEGKQAKIKRRHTKRLPLQRERGINDNLLMEDEEELEGDYDYIDSPRIDPADRISIPDWQPLS